LAEITTISTSVAIKDAIAKIGLQHQRYQSIVEEEKAFLTKRSSYDRNAYKIAKEKAADAVLSDLKDLESLFRQEFLHKTLRAEQAEGSSRLVTIVTFALTVLLVIFLSLLITRSITNPISKLVEKTRQFQKGRFDCDLETSGPQEVRELAVAYNRMCSQLRQVDQLKTDFFAMISHQLRTPLTTIREGSGLLLEGTCGAVTDKQNRLLTIIVAESKRLTDMVDSILNLSKMEAGMMAYHWERLRIEPFIDQALEEISPYAQAKSIEIVKRITHELPPCRIDAERILDVLRNLLGNAIRFMPDGGRITLSVERQNEEVSVSVQDTGPGIPQDKLMTIFDKYASLDRKKGTGLGLAIVRHIITAHGGKVWAQNNPGGGSCFIFVLPA
jgi:two-component system sensor histidine kinase GlrK